MLLSTASEHSNIDDLLLVDKLGSRDEMCVGKQLTEGHFQVSSPFDSLLVLFLQGSHAHLNSQICLI